MNTARKIDEELPPVTESTVHKRPEVVLAEAIAIPNKPSFFRKLLAVSFGGGLAGFTAGMILTVLILQGKLDVDKQAIKAFLRTLTGH